jgi:zinc protease
MTAGEGTLMAKDGVFKTRLDNGLKVLIKEMHHAPVASWWVWYKVGSRNERPGVTGISHWVEHMQFKGTQRYPSQVLDKLISRVGGMWNAMTFMDWTTYFETMPAGQIELGLDLEADRMLNSTFDPDEVASERTVIISERQGSENSPSWLLYEELIAAAFRVHPYRKTVVGDQIDLETMTRDDLYNHYRAYYVPNNATAVLVGDVDTQAMLARIAELYGSIPPGPQPPPVHFVEPPQYGERRVEVRREGLTAYIQTAYHAPGIGDPDFFPLAILDTILAGASSFNFFSTADTSNKTSRLYQALVETELAASVDAGLITTLDPYLYTFSATVRAGRTCEEVQAALDEELARAAWGDISEREFEKAHKQTKAIFAYDSESVSSQGLWLGLAETLVDDYIWFETFLDKLMAVTLDDVRRVAAEVLRPTRRTVGWYIPTGEASGNGQDGSE